MSFSIIFAGLLIILGHAFKVLFDKTRVPDVIPMVLLGVLAGPVFGFVSAHNFGIMGEMLGTVALSIILFYSGLEINIETATKSLLSGTRIALLNFLLSSLVVALMVQWWLQVPVMESFAIGALLGGTSFAIVIPLAKGMKIAARTKTILLLESTFTDVLCIVVTLGILQMIRLREMNPGFMVGQILASFTMSSVIGMVAAVFWATSLRWVRKLENDMLLTPAFIVTVFGVTEFLGYSGAISSLAFGMVSGNIKRIVSYPLFGKVNTANILEFNSIELSLFSELVFLLKIFFFFYIGISIRMTNLPMMAGGVVLTLLIFLGRMLSVKASTDSSTPYIDKAAIAAMGPKGLVSAVLLSLTANAGFKNIALVQELVYSTILFSIVFSSAVVFFLEKGYFEEFGRRLFGAGDCPPAGHGAGEETHGKS